jgi:hypothetical protein
MDQERSERFGKLKADAQREIDFAIKKLEEAANILARLATIYPEDNSLRESIMDIVENEEAGIRKRMRDFHDLISEIASLEHYGID